MVALREGREGEKEPAPRALGQVGGGQEPEPSQAGQAEAEHRRRVGENPGGHPSIVGGRGKAGGRAHSRAVAGGGGQRREWIRPSMALGETRPDCCHCA